MSCEGNRHKFFVHTAAQSGSGMSAEALEALYQANRRKPATPAEAAAAEAKTRRVFAMIQALGLHPPTHSADGLPKMESRLGYAAVYDCLKGRGLLPTLQQATAVVQAPAPTAPAVGLDGRDADGYDRWGYDRDGFDRSGHDRYGFDRRGLDRNGCNRYGFDHHGYDQKGFNAQGYNRKGFDRKGFSQLGYNKNNLDEDGYDQNGYKDGYDRAGYDTEGKDRSGNLHPFFTTLGPDGLYLDGRDAEGFDPDGYDISGRDRFGFDREGYNSHNLDRRGLGRNGRDAQGCDPEGYDQQGFRREADGKKRDRWGYDESGFDQNGYTVTGYDRNGLDRNGQERARRDKRGSLTPCKFCKSGWDTDGYDRWGFHRKDGLTAPDANGLRHNGWGWAYDEDTRECYDPQDPARRISHAYSFYWDRYEKRILYGRRFAPEPPPPGPSPVTPKAAMTREEFDRTIPPYYNAHSRDRFYDEALHPDGRMAARWQQSGRALGDPLACRGGVLMRCPHCGQFTGAGAHVCPNFNGQMVEVHRSGVVFEHNRYGRILHLPGREGYDPDYPNGYNQAGRDRDNFDRLGYNPRGFDRQGYSPDGFDVLGYDRDGFDREGYNNAGYNRAGEKRARSLAGLANLLEPGQDLLANQDLASLYSQIATGLVGQPRRVVLVEGGGFGTDMRGTITADPYPLGRQADPRHNLVVTRAGIHHELGHELFTPPEIWAQVVEAAQGKQTMEGLGEAGAKMLPRFFNVIEDGRMERRLANGYAGVAEVLAASCRLEPRWDEQVGEAVPVGQQVFWALLYTSLPFFRLRDEVRTGMPPQARALFDELEPVVRQAVQGNAEVALAAAVHLARRFEEEGLIELPPQEYSPPVQPPPGTKPRQGQPGSGGQGQQKPQEQAGAGQKVSGGQAASEKQPGSSGEQGEDQGAAGGQGKKADAGQDAGQQAAGQGAGGAGEKQGEKEAAAGQGSGAGSGGGEQPGRGKAGGLGDPGQSFGQKELDEVVRSVERQAAAAIESGVRRRSRKDTIGKPLHRPLSERSSTSQRYFSPEGAVEDAHVDLPRTDSEQARELEPRRASHKAVAADLARQLRAIREQTEQTLRRQSEGRLDRHQLVGAVKGLTDVHTRTRQMPHTSFAVSLAVDLSGSMDEHIYSGSLYDATMTLGDTFDQLEMPYEVRGFGSTDAQFKAMDDPGFAPERAACLTSLDLGGTLGARTAGLAASALLARDEKNKLVVVLSDGEMGDHDRTARTLQQARRDGVVTFGLFLGGGANPERMDQLYGPGNWATIHSLGEMPAEVGRRLASLFKRLRK